MQDSPSSAVFKKLREEREKQRLSINTLATMANIDQASLTRLERGLREPRFDSVVKVCKALDLSLWEILKGLDI